jgi:hypothetical protein
MAAGKGQSHTTHAKTANQNIYVQHFIPSKGWLLLEEKGIPMSPA